MQSIHKLATPSSTLHPALCRLTLFLDGTRESVHSLWDLGPGIPQHPHKLSSEGSLVCLTGEEGDGLSGFTSSTGSTASVDKVLCGA